MKQTCSVCGEIKEDFCRVCQMIVAKEDGLLVNVCIDCCSDNQKEKDDNHNTERSVLENSEQ